MDRGGEPVITAVDSSVLLDVLLDDPKHGSGSLASLRRARGEGALVACPVVWAEVCAAAPGTPALRDRLVAAGISFDPFDEACAQKAGEIWAAYRAAGGKRERLIPDFLVGAHALVKGARLLSRDRGFFRVYFKGLTVVEPSLGKV
jgi:predicted nucleic acid-binding protein